ncbi:fumarylacetoacetate hydrolase family protein [Rubripirellula amarantea]|uniref:Ureidoglycolate lyase n=1 Tax=Rubripirellula amarantea TaxID=2527999 RepID=A0A5C5WVE9_9BACT|nr:fumarylacetoacetate hydrolase family protein [Rubripirellula amarantea]MDA8744248.1 fumarylacetoacetate hydrolase family protein [Rubripirellula amarantea]TWT54229.1 Ureidoglycolate lyase [Rubripirellula amarantea]
MKLTRFHNDAGIAPAVFADEQTLLDCSSFGQDWNEDFFAGDGLARLTDFVATNGSSLPSHDVNDVRLAPAIARPSKIVCIGLNYAKHAAESGMDAPTEPVLFFKATTAWSGPNDPVVIPRGSLKSDWEVELAFVIGKRAKYVSIDDAMNHVAGYAIHNDYSERHWQLERGGQWVKGKSADTYAPFGPFMATADEVPNPDNLHLWLKRNGQTLQDSNTSDFIFGIKEVVSYVSQFMTLLPGDVISTGTPAGVGLGLKPPEFLKAGDVIELGIEGLGVQKQTAVQEE